MLLIYCDNRAYSTMQSRAESLEQMTKVRPSQVQELMYGKWFEDYPPIFELLRFGDAQYVQTSDLVLIIH